MKSTSSRLLVLFGILLGLVVPIFGGSPVMVMIISQAMAAIVPGSAGPDALYL